VMCNRYAESLLVSWNLPDMGLLYPFTTMILF
jgi:hypothetical protein